MYTFKENINKEEYNNFIIKFPYANFMQEKSWASVKDNFDNILCGVYDNLYEENNFFTLDDILELFDRKPWIKSINEDIIQKKVCSTLSEELEETIHLCDVQDLNKAKKFIENHFGV